MQVQKHYVTQVQHIMQALVAQQPGSAFAPPPPAVAGIDMAAISRACGAAMGIIQSVDRAAAAPPPSAFLPGALLGR